MRIVSAAGQGTFEDALSGALAAILAALDGDAPDLVLAFVSPQFGEACAALGPVLRETFADAHVLGCGAHGVIGDGSEHEGSAALSLTACVLPDVNIQPFSLFGGEGADVLGGRIGVDAADAPQFLLFTDPYSCDAAALASAMDAVFPGAPKVGGIASGTRQPGDTLLLLDDEVMRLGAVGVALTGNVVIDPVVAQGCRPVGQPLFVTQSDSNVIRRLDDETALDAAQATYEALDAADRALAQRALFLGVAMRGQRERYGLGDFLIRHIMGNDPASGALSVGALIAPGDIVQFHVRDAQTSAEELQGMLAAHAGPRPAGALLFSCLGRGAGLYGVPHHDSSLIRERFGAISVSGFFCNGEIGPVGDRTFVHGYTAAIALLRPRSKRPARAPRSTLPR